MKAFVTMWCEHAGIVRVGAQAEKFGDAYEYALAFRVEGKIAIVEGLCCPISVSAVRAGIRALKLAGYQTAWDRRKNGTIRRVIVK